MDERELYGFKWFDYRPLTPDMATMAFAQAYCRKLAAYYELLGEEISPPQASNMFYVGMKLPDFRAWKHFESVEKLRRWADQRGMRYQDFWSYAFEAYSRLGFGTSGLKGREYRYISFNRFLNKTLLKIVVEQREAAYKTFITLSDKPYFQASAYRGDPLQDEYYLYILQEVAMRYPSQIYDRVKILTANGRFSTHYLLRKAA